MRPPSFADYLSERVERRSVVHRVQKFVEVSTGRIGYAMNAAALSEVSNGAEWNPDPSFSVAEAILDDPTFASVLRAVLVVVPAAETKGK